MIEFILLEHYTKLLLIAVTLLLVWLRFRKFQRMRSLQQQLRLVTEVIENPELESDIELPVAYQCRSINNFHLALEYEEGTPRRRKLISAAISDAESILSIDPEGVEDDKYGDIHGVVEELNSLQVEDKPILLRTVPGLWLLSVAVSIVAVIAIRIDCIERERIIPVVNEYVALRQRIFDSDISTERELSTLLERSESLNRSFGSGDGNLYVLEADASFFPDDLRSLQKLTADAKCKLTFPIRREDIIRIENNDQCRSKLDSRRYHLEFFQEWTEQAVIRLESKYRFTVDRN